MAVPIAEKILEKLPRKGRKEMLLLVFIISGFLFAVLALVFSYHLGSEQSQFSPLLSPLVSYHAEFMMVVATLGLAVGAGAFYLIAEISEKGKAETKWNANLLLKFLGEDEREVVAYVLSKRGVAYQSEISSLRGMTRLKAHRIVSKLSKRGIISVRRAGKINVLEMPHELLDGLKYEKE